MVQKRRLPAEWEAQDGVLLAWPHHETDWENSLGEVERVYLELTRTISRHEKVVIVSPEVEKVEESLKHNQISLDNIITACVPTNDTWTRDYGPISVDVSGHMLLLNFDFNGWGDKFPAGLDNQVSRRLVESKTLSAQLETPGLVLEGGSIESDGKGTLMTTSECLLNPNRNPHLDRSSLEEHLRSLFGCDQVLWLDHGYLAGDDTDSHIDTLARLAPDGTILYVACKDQTDEHYKALVAMKEQLESFKTLAGCPFRLLELPMPDAVYNRSGKRLPATYANYLVINNAVIVPCYSDRNDDLALEIIAKAFPEREVLGLDCSPLIQQHGSLHCITMQLAKGVLS